MKKIKFLLALVTILMVISTSCTKKDDVVTPPALVYNQPTAYLGTWTNTGGGELVITTNSLKAILEGVQNPNVANWEVKNDHFYEYKNDGNVYANFLITQVPTNGVFIMGGITYTKQ